MNSLNLKLATVENNTREALLNALKELATIDADFNGENGEEYLWPDAKTGRYESNMDYLINDVKDIKNDEELVKEYINRWVGADSYYLDHILEIKKDNKENIKAIALAVIY